MADRLVLVSQRFHPEFASTAQLLTELAEGLNESGVGVRVYTAQPSYVDHPVTLPRGEVLGGVEVIRLRSTRFSKHSVLGRAMNEVTFSANVLLHLLCSRDRAPLLLGSNPPFLAWVGWITWCVRRRKYGLLVHDVYPDVAISLGYLRRTGLTARVWGMLNRRAYRHAAWIIVLGERMRQAVCGYTRGREAAVCVIHNWADGKRLTPREKADNAFAEAHGVADKLVVLYSGNHGRFHDLETVVMAAASLRAREEIAFLFIGEGVKKQTLVDLARREGLQNVRFLPYQDRMVFPLSVIAGDIAVVTLEKGVEGLCVPSKLYTHLAAGQAILALVGTNSEVADIVEEFNCGFRVDQGDVRGVANALVRWHTDPRLLQEMKANARRCFEQNFEKDRALGKYRALIAEM